jgi:indole-3-glycerol phosphate synthase
MSKQLTSAEGHGIATSELLMVPPETYLDRIVARKVEQWSTGGSVMPPAAGVVGPSVGRFREALVKDHVAIIAEVKPRSPSKGHLWPARDAPRLARKYSQHGAAAISVLADEEFFGGSPDLVATVAADPEIDVPILYKDIVVDPRQIELASASRAGGVLVIVRTLSNPLLALITQLARDYGLDPLHECFDEHDIERALAVGADLVGVNNRDLMSFEVDLERGARLRDAIPPGIVTVSESGLGSPADVEKIASQGYHACLVGEALLGAQDLPGMLAQMSSVSRQVALDHPSNGGERHHDLAN